MWKKFFVLLLLLGLVGCINNPNIPDKGIKPKNPLVMNSYFSDGMVIQQDQPINVIGRSEEGVLIEVKLSKKDSMDSIATGKAFVNEKGEWKVILPPLNASFQLYKMTITDSVYTKEINEILIGDVWLTSGEKNMSWPLRYTKDASNYVIHNEDTKYIRYFTQDHYPNGDPGSNMSSEPDFEFSRGQWVLATSIKSLDASALSYIFACEIFKEVNRGFSKVPVAFIESAVADSNIHAWLPKQAIDSNPYLKNQLENKGFYQTTFNDQGNKNYNQMSVLYNHKINPLHGVNFKGVLWYQGISDVDNYEYYNEALRTLIDSWLKELALDLAFVIVGEHSYQKDNLACFRQAQILGTNYHSKVVYVPTYDLEFEYEYQEGYDMEPLLESSPYYPINKIEVAKRVANAAISLVYKNNDKYLSPRLQNYTISLIDNTVTLYFANAKDLKIKGVVDDADDSEDEYQTITNLMIVLKDGTEEVAQVRIQENMVKIFYDDLQAVQAIKYAYLDETQDSNLFNESDLPTLPFYLTIKWYQK